ncbi:membrane associated rhomboid family serine protease [Rhodovulum imhoffii]|uniref:Membrane associated rhomboid family serine protease n=1 Tax=Rhodovulum imhoffii TaxID=365340 RepID=A0A2T5BS12_9RHOB|nr:rhomboid family intramembrane serine protease [Rhodovulum imhoffii]MBK5933156.1 rhomboid family intramembrane serine protease [Rhodovulum imhoffii]PTN02096.1 membrane associated rhomboid family serine protease [Rhodovulum imhoffii]
MLPIRDHNPSRRTPYVTIALIVTNVVVFLSYWNLFADPAALNRFFYNWALIPAALSQGDLMHGLFTSMFLHGGVMHLGGNMLFLWIFGDNLEDEMGHLGFAIFYLAGGLLAGLAQYVTDPSSTVPMVGASGAIAAVMGGYLLMFPKAQVDILIILIVIFRILPVPAWLMLAIWFTLQLVSGSMAATEEGGVAYWAHAGGFIAGVILTLPLWLKRGGSAFWSRTRGHPPHPVVAYRHTPIPRIRR